MILYESKSEETINLIDLKISVKAVYDNDDFYHGQALTNVEIYIGIENLNWIKS
jgi:hypothetical protein